MLKGAPPAEPPLQRQSISKSKINREGKGDIRTLREAKSQLSAKVGVTLKRAVREPPLHRQRQPAVALCKRAPNYWLPPADCAEDSLPAAGATSEWERLTALIDFSGPAPNNSGWR